MKDIIIAIDGHSASGKGTLAKQLAQKLNYNYIDTGAMYRAITLFFIENKIEIIESNINSNISKINLKFKFNSQINKSEILLNNINIENKIRTHLINQNVSLVSSFQSVRELAILQQQEIGKEKKVVMDGRDIGTNVFPNAEIKFFITADINERAKRRFLEMQKNNIKESYENILKNLIHRDKTDSERLINPLIKAEDAILINNTNLSIEEQFEKCYNIIIKTIK